MTRYVFYIVCLIASSAGASAWADVTYDRTKQGESDIDVIRMSVTPAAEPVPALKYRFLAREIDLKPGNAVPFYYRALLSLPSMLQEQRKKFDEEKELENWYSTGIECTPIAELPLEKVREATKMFDTIYERQLIPAFERANCDWEQSIGELRGPEVIEYLLPEFQSSRDLARLMAMRTRLAVAEHRYDDAITLIQQQYRLGADVAKEPILVCGLIGTAIDEVADGTLTELIASRNSPNLYWALTELPQPAVSLQKAVRYEMDFGPRLFPLIEHPETADRAPQEWNRLFTETIYNYSRIGGNLMGGNNGKPVDKLESGVAATSLALMGYSRAKEQLIADGMDRERVEQMAVGQVIAIYTARMNAKYGDDFQKLWYLPYAEWAQRLNEEDKTLSQIAPLGRGKDREIIPMISLLLPGIQNSRQAQVRAEREVAALRVIEALRMYAAKHGDTMPKTLSDITEVPVPVNPATGKSFAYRLDGKTAVLELPASDQLPHGNCRYEIQIATDKK